MIRILITVYYTGCWSPFNCLMSFHAVRDANDIALVRELYNGNMGENSSISEFSISQISEYEFIMLAKSLPVVYREKTGSRNRMTET